MALLVVFLQILKAFVPTGLQGLVVLEMGRGGFKSKFHKYRSIL